MPGNWSSTVPGTRLPEHSVLCRGFLGHPWVHTSTFMAGAAAVYFLYHNFVWRHFLCIGRTHTYTYTKSRHILRVSRLQVHLHNIHNCDSCPADRFCQYKSMHQTSFRVSSPASRYQEGGDRHRSTTRVLRTLSRSQIILRRTPYLSTKLSKPRPMLHLRATT